MCGFAMYDLPNVDVVGYDVVSNRPKVAAYRAPGAPISSFAVESCIDDLARKLGIDPLTLREKNAARNGIKDALRRRLISNIGFEHGAGGGEEPSALEVAAEAGPGPRHRLRLLVQHRRRIDGAGARQRGRHGDGGDRQPGYRRLARLDGMMVAEVLGIPADKVRTIVADTGSIGFTFLTGGCRVTFATGMAVTQAAEKVVEELKKRAAMIWEIPADAVEWKDGKAFPGRFQRRRVRAAGSGARSR